MPKPNAILFELNGGKGISFEDEEVVRILRRADYDFFAIPRHSLRMRLIPVRSLSRSEIKGHDFLAAPKGRMFDEISRLVRAAR